MNFDETCFLCNAGELKFLGIKNKPLNGKNCSDSRFSINILWDGNEAGVNGPVIFMAKGTKVQPRLKDTNLVTIQGLPKVYCVIPNKEAYMDDETSAKVVKVVSSSIRKMKAINVACVFPIFLSIYLNIHLCPSKLSSNDLLFPKAVVIPHI